jgi:hypothetical protein
MTHHSQFKCVEVLSAQEYGNGTTYNSVEDPEIVFEHTDPPSLARRIPSSSGAGTLDGCPDARIPTGAEAFAWTPNDCQYTANFRRAGIDALNPRHPRFSCGPIELSDLQPGVRLVAVGYQNAACERSDAVTVTSGDYIRGCVNECAEQTKTACPNYDPSTPPESNRYTCDDEATAAFGRIECGCGRSYGGANCEIGCPGDDLHLDPNFSIETRNGYWMCGRVVASTGEMSGSGYTLRGYIPVGPVDGTVLEGGGYRLEAR